MSWWSDALNWLNNTPTVPNNNGPLAADPGDPDGFQYNQAPATEQRALMLPGASPWDGWPTGWQTPDWQIDNSLNKLADIAWACLDLSSNIVSAMPVYRLRNGKVMPPTAWMMNPDPLIYTCWQEFA